MPKGWDGEPLLSPEEVKRQWDHFQWLVDDFDKWEAELSEDDKAKQEAYEESMRNAETGAEVRQQFQQDFDKAFDDANVSNSGLLNEEEFKNWMVNMQ